MTAICINRSAYCQEGLTGVIVQMTVMCMHRQCSVPAGRQGVCATVVAYRMLMTEHQRAVVLIVVGMVVRAVFGRNENVCESSD